MLCVVCCCGARGCGGGGGRGGGGREINRTIWAKVSLKIAQTEHPYNHPVADSLHSVPQESWS